MFDGNFRIINESSSVDSVVPITTVFDIFAISLSSSIFGSKLYILKWMKYIPLFLKTFQFFLTDACFELAVGLDLYPLTGEVVVSNRRSRFLMLYFAKGIRL